MAFFGRRTDMRNKEMKSLLSAPTVIRHLHQWGRRLVLCLFRHNMQTSDKVSRYQPAHIRLLISSLTISIFLTTLLGPAEQSFVPLEEDAPAESMFDGMTASTQSELMDFSDEQNLVFFHPLLYTADMLDPTLDNFGLDPLVEMNTATSW